MSGMYGCCHSAVNTNHLATSCDPQGAVGKDVSSMEQVMERVAKAVETDKVETVTMTVGTQRRAVLEAVAYGTFLRDVETWVQTDYNLLTPLPPPRITGRDSIDDGDIA